MIDEDEHRIAAADDDDAAAAAAAERAGDAWMRRARCCAICVELLFTLVSRVTL